MSRLPVTVIVPVKNEEVNLPRCLSAIGGDFAEVFVVDSGSTDRTGRIAHEYGATVVDFAWNGKFPKKRNWFLNNYRVCNDWCLFLDADEVISDAFKAEVAAAIKNERNVGYWLNYTNYFLGRPLRHGVAQRKLALFRKSAGRYERIEEDHWSKLDMEVHEHPQLEGPVGEIVARIDHRDLQGLGKFLSRHLDYARWELGRYKKVAGSEKFERLTDRQKAKYRHIERAWFPLAYFLFAYIVKKGILDGSAGLQYALYKAWYFNTIRLMIHEQRQAHNN